MLLGNDPLTALDPGFQLSFVATEALLLAKRIPLASRAWPARWGLGALNAVWVTFAAVSGTAPLCIYYFYSLVPIALLTNLLAELLVTLGTVGGLILGALGPWLFGLGKPAGWAVGWSGEMLLRLAQWAERCPKAEFFYGQETGGGSWGVRPGARAFLEKSPLGMAPGSAGVGGGLLDVSPGTARCPRRRASRF